MINLFASIWGIIVVVVVVTLMFVGGVILMFGKIVSSIGHLVMTDFDEARNQYKDFWPWIVVRNALDFDDDMEP